MSNGERCFCGCVAFAVALVAAAGTVGHAALARAAAPPPAGAALTFADLLQLSAAGDGDDLLRQRVDDVLTTATVSNEASRAGVMPRRPEVPGVGPVVRIVFWNVARGDQFDLIAAALGHEPSLDRPGDSHPGNSGARTAVRATVAYLSDADVIVLNEADVGMPRSGYRHVAADLAERLGMNYAFAAEFVELSDLIGRAQSDGPTSEIAVDRDRYVGLHGTAVLSRYPIRDAAVHRLHTPYDWYASEVRPVGPLEKLRRWSAARVFAERIEPEIRYGSRIALVARLEVPDAPGGEFAVVSPHLENKCSPRCRRRQMEETLERIRDIRGPVVLAGDLNTTGRDASPTSVWRNVRDRVVQPQFWSGWVHDWLSPMALPRLLLVPANHTRNYLDPTRRHVPVLSPNPEADLFRMVERFRFDDGGAFAFRDVDACGHTRGKTLSNSNARGRKGFRPTFALERHYAGLAGHYKTDWLIVKPAALRLAPSAPRTFTDLNDHFGERVSDHFPITADLVLDPPPADCATNSPGNEVRAHDAGSGAESDSAGDVARIVMSEGEARPPDPRGEGD